MDSICAHHAILDAKDIVSKMLGVMKYCSKTVRECDSYNS